MTFSHQFSLLWLLAWAALAFFGLSVCWLITSTLWHLWRNRFVGLEKMSIPSKHGEPELYAEPPKTEPWIQVAKMMLLATALLGAYDIGTRVSYSQEHAAWKQQQADWQKNYAAWQQRRMNNGNQIPTAR